jgi:hypothetical protein
MIIRTKYMGPTTTKGSRIKAKSITGKSVTISWDDALNIDNNHRAAAIALLDLHDRGAYSRDRYSCFWDEGGGAVFSFMEGRDEFPL